ncbi:hypothetical protein GOODEAATRI_032601, partial [Goodea atripinnis]
MNIFTFLDDGLINALKPSLNSCIYSRAAQIIHLLTEIGFSDRPTLICGQLDQNVETSIPRDFWVAAITTLFSVDFEEHPKLATFSISEMFKMNQRWKKLLKY